MLCGGLFLELLFIVIFRKKEVGWACGAYGGGEGGV